MLITLHYNDQYEELTESKMMDTLRCSIIFTLFEWLCKDILHLDNFIMSGLSFEIHTLAF